VPALAPLESHYDFARFGVSGVVVVVLLFILHMWLPAGRRGFGAVWPGILATMVLWLICGFTFGHYLAEFAYNVCELLRRTDVGDDRAGVSLLRRLDFCLRHRAQRRDRAPAGGEGVVRIIAS
jgi:hypothetical protein